MIVVVEGPTAAGRTSRITGRHSRVVGESALARAEPADPELLADRTFQMTVAFVPAAPKIREQPSEERSA